MAAPAPVVILRFGRAMAELLLEAGHEVRAHDPAAEVPDELRADSLEALLAPPATVLLCVPVHAVDAALDQVADRLGPEHLVIDVCSAQRASGPSGKGGSPNRWRPFLSILTRPCRISRSTSPTPSCL